MRSERRLRVTRGDMRSAVGSIALVADAAGGRESSLDEGARVMTGRCGGSCGLRADRGDWERERSEAGEAERLLQLRSHRSGVIREPGIRHGMIGHGS